MEPSAGRLDPNEMTALFVDLTSVSLGFDDDAWEVTDVWLEAPPGSEGELHIRVSKRKGAQPGCPVCGGRAGTCDGREHTWRHSDLWEPGTYVHRGVPRTYCERCGAETYKVDWETRKDEHLAGRMEAKAMRGCQKSTTHAVSELVGESDGRLWGLTGRAVAQALGSAD